MICFLTSRTYVHETGEMNPANGFKDELRRCFPENCRALQICSDPDSWERTDFYASFLKESFEKAGFGIENYRTLDGRNAEHAAELIKDSDLIVLSGGHVPTQNKFFHKIGLRGLMKDFSGIVIGISAGSMNSAEVVYAQPEEEGEAVDPGYRKFLTGLGLTKTMLLPHYQEVKDDVLDGLRVFEDVTYPDSMGRTFYAIPDGSYLFIEDGREELRGEAYRIKDGVIERISGDGDTVLLSCTERDTDDLKLVRPDENYLEQIRRFREEFADCLDWLHGAQGLRHHEDPAEWLRYLALCSDESTVPEGDHLYSQFLCVRQTDGKIVGTVGVRHKPVGPLETWGGHVGYCVCPSERRKGYATWMLREVLPYCRSLGLDRILLTAGDENQGSVKTILANGGVLESYVMTPRHPMPVGRYWIDLSD